MMKAIFFLLETYLPAHIHNMLHKILRLAVHRLKIFLLFLWKRGCSRGQRGKKPQGRVGTPESGPCFAMDFQCDIRQVSALSELQCRHHDGDRSRI